nr:MAG TPA: response regulator [Caudoviricetes sp.]
MYKILVVDDENLIRQGIIAQLEFLNYEFEEILEADTGNSALRVLRESNPDIVITDISMPEMDGLSFVEEAKKEREGTKFILLSGYAEFSYAQKAISLGISEYLLKPVSKDKLKECIDKVIYELKSEKMIKEASIHKGILTREKAEYLFEKDFNLLVKFGVHDVVFRHVPISKIC